MEDQACIGKCRSVQHGNLITAIARKGTDQQIVSLWAKTCQNYANVKDCFSRTALHMISSTPHVKVVEWLLQHEGVNIQAKEPISGYTALHRSIFYGQLNVARTLIQNGASLYSTDNEGLTPMDLYLVDRNRNFPLVKDFRIHADPTEVYIWGTNANYNLGTGSSSARNIPEPLEVFGNAKISQIVLQTYHSIFLSQDGVVFTCGVGLGGRLGLGNERSALKPTAVKINSNYRCTFVAADENHTLFLLENGDVLSCGLNENFVLGQNTPHKKIFAPKRIDIHIRIEKICTSRYHSAFYFRNCLYVCGTNYGQMGMDTPCGSSIVIPKATSVISQIKELSPVLHVECNKYATVLQTQHELVLLYHFACKKVKLSGFEIAQMFVVGGYFNTNVLLDSNSSTAKIPKISESDGSSNLCPLTIIFLTVDGRIYLWRENISSTSPDITKSNHSQQQQHRSSSHYADGVFSKLYSNIGRSLSVKNLSVNKTYLLVASGDGEAFQGQWNCEGTPSVYFPNSNNANEDRPARSANNHEWITYKNNKRRDENSAGNIRLEYIKFKRIPNIYAAVSLTCDPKGKTFAVIQSHQRSTYIKIPTVCASTMNFELEQLYHNTTLDDDLHDVVFEVENSSGKKTKFPAHKFIIGSSCTILYNEIKNFEVNYSTNSDYNDDDSSKGPITIPISVSSEIIFEQILEYIYTNKCSVIVPDTALKYNWAQDIETCNRILRELKTYSRKLELVTLFQKLHDVDIINGIVCLRNRVLTSFNKWKPKIFDPNSFQALTDITLRTSDNKDIKAHRCILFARMEYFRVLWTGNHWKDSSSETVQIPTSYFGAKFLLDYLYADKKPDPLKYDTLLHDTRNRGAGNLIDEKLSWADMAAEALSTSDYFFINGLKTRTELVFYEIMNYKNVTKILTIANYLNAEQLKEACCHFISLNVAPLLENKLLDDLSNELMDTVTEYYQNFHPYMHQRKLKPDSVLTPNDDVYEQILEELHPEFELFVNDFEEYTATMAAYGTTPTSSSTTNKAPRRKRHKSRTHSESEAILNNNKDSLTSVSNSFEENDDPFLPVTSASTLKYEKPAPSAKVYLPENNVVVKPRQISTPIQIPFELGSTSNAKYTCVISFNVISAPDASIRKSPGHDIVQGTRAGNGIVERTRTFSTEEFPSLETQDSVVKDTDNVNSRSNSLGNSLESTKDFATTSNNLKPSKPAASKKRTKWVSLDSSSEADLQKKQAAVTAAAALSGSSDRDPKNPWTKLKTADDSINSATNETEQQQNIYFREIVKDEQEKAQNWKKVTSKPFRLMQIEEKAMEELMKRYSSEDTIDGIERITVERVSVKNVGNPPSWPPNSPSTPSTSKYYK